MKIKEAFFLQVQLVAAKNCNEILSIKHFLTPAERDLVIGWNLHY
ncbi:unnamed protein product [Rhodiola kirilowii]